MNDNSALGRTWEEVRSELFTPEEIAESNMRVALMKQLVEARRSQGITQKQLEQLSGVSQPVIARMESGSTSPQIGTLIKVLRPLGLTMKIVPVSES
ncbi:MAG: helix-turn-helix transcriptional regulator [Oscillospiraceae bacterium]|nr:helix-turn-helix transcriptional regulator [Oscillospiraceae bacterium]